MTIQDSVLLEREQLKAQVSPLLLVNTLLFIFTYALIQFTTTNTLLLTTVLCLSTTSITVYLFILADYVGDNIRLIYRCTMIKLQIAIWLLLVCLCLNLYNTSRRNSNKSAI